jgi:hypothetical protein
MTSSRGAPISGKRSWDIYKLENGTLKFLGRVVTSTEPEAIVKAQKKWRAGEPRALIAKLTKRTRNRQRREAEQSHV